MRVDGRPLEAGVGGAQGVADVFRRESPGTVSAVAMNDQLRQGCVRKLVFWGAAV